MSLIRNKTDKKRKIRTDEIRQGLEPKLNVRVVRVILLRTKKQVL